MNKYVITDDHGSYIRKDEYSKKYVPVKSFSAATVFDERHLAQNVIKNCLGKKLRKAYHVVAVAEEITPRPQLANKIEKKNDKNKVAKELSIQKPRPAQTEKWSSGAAQFESILFDAEKRKAQLVEDLRNIDREIVDIEHYIEIGKFNAYQGWLAFSMLKGRLKRRREIKDELNVIMHLKRCKVTHDIMNEINEAIKAYQNRQYKPRVLTQLFE